MQHWTFDVNRWIKGQVKKMAEPEFDWEKDRLEYEESEAILNGLGPTLDASRKVRQEWSKAIEEVPDTAEEVLEILNNQLDTSDLREPYHHETQPAFGEHGAWQEWYIEHSNCGGTWVYVKDPCNPRVVCSCSMGMGDGA